MTSTWFDPNDPMGSAAPSNDELALQRARAQAMRQQSGQRQPQQGGGIDPMDAYNAYSKFTGGGGAMVGGGAGETAGGAGVQSSGIGTAANSSNVAQPAWMSGGGGASSGGAASGSGMSAFAGPAALAAAIYWMEDKQNKEGNRASGSKAEYVGDMASGKVLERDAERYLGKDAAKLIRHGTPSGMVRTTKDSWKKLKDWF